MRKLLAVLAFCCSASLLAAQQLPDTISKKSKGSVDTSTVLLRPISGVVFDESVVAVRPDFLSGPALAYPDSLRHAGIQGRVIVQAILDTTGRAEPPSVKIIESPNPGFDEPARNFVLGALFRPARIRGRAVRVLVNLPLDFKIDPKH